MFRLVVICVYIIISCKVDTIIVFILDVDL